MNKHSLKELQEIAVDAEIIYDNIPNNIEELLKQKFLEYSQANHSNSTKKGCNTKAIKARRKRNKNKKTHRK